MVRSRPAPGCATLCCAWLCLAGAVCAPALGQESLASDSMVPGPVPTVDKADSYRLVCKFDFNERPLGNYDETPMYWVRLRGDGLPPFASGRFDETVGHDAPPSFRLSLQTGNVAYECQQPELVVVPESDYYVVAHVRAEQLVNARAFLAAHFVDRFGERIPGSERISGLVRSTGQSPEPWQRVSLTLTAESPAAYALRMQVWVLQSYVWRQAGDDMVDPIVRRDVYASAWFDDLQVFRLPRATLRFSNDGHIVAPGAQEGFILELGSGALENVEAELLVLDDAGREVHASRIDLRSAARQTAADESATRPSGEPAADIDSLAYAEHAAARVRIALPDLPPGTYTTRVRLQREAETLLERVSRVAVLPELPVEPGPATNLGVDLGEWPVSGAAGVMELLDALGCGAVKLGLPLRADSAGGAFGRYLTEVVETIRVLNRRRVDVTGTFLAPDAQRPGRHVATRAVLRQDSRWRERLSPILAHLGGLLPTWQTGDEDAELRTGEWEADELSALREHLMRFMTLPTLVVPAPLADAKPLRQDVSSVLVPAGVPTRTMPGALDFLTLEQPGARFWITLQRADDPQTPPRWQAIDAARRVVLGSALAPERVYVPAPFERIGAGSERNWHPTAEYIALRTVFHHLAGKHCVTAMQPDPTTVALIFKDSRGACLVMWSWRDDAPAEPVELYLGGAPVAVDLFGRRVPLEERSGRTRVPVGAAPLFVSNFDPGLAQLQASYSLTPAYVELHSSEPKPVLTFENPYDELLQGEVRLTPPGAWQVEPQMFSFSLPPGGRFEQPLEILSPPRQVASTYDLQVQMSFNGPRQTTMEFREAITLGLRDLVVESNAYWQDDDLVVEQTLRNLSDQVISFTSYCQARDRPRVDRMLLEVQPGQIETCYYLFDDARDLAGTLLYVGVDEIRGERSLNQLVAVPE